MHGTLRLPVPFLALLVGCGGASSGVLGKSPSAAVKEFYAAANEGRYSDAEKYLSTEAMAAIKDSSRQLSGAIEDQGVKVDFDMTPLAVKSLCNTITKEGKIKNVEILKEDIRGERATVTARILFADGTSNASDITQLIKEKGQWKVGREPNRAE